MQATKPGSTSGAASTAAGSGVGGPDASSQAGSVRTGMKSKPNYAAVVLASKFGDRVPFTEALPYDNMECKYRVGGDTFSLTIDSVYNMTEGSQELLAIAMVVNNGEDKIYLNEKTANVLCGACQKVIGTGEAWFVEPEEWPGKAPNPERYLLIMTPTSFNTFMQKKGRVASKLAQDTNVQEVTQARVEQIQAGNLGGLNTGLGSIPEEPAIPQPEPEPEPEPQLEPKSQPEPEPEPAA